MNEWLKEHKMIVVISFFGVIIVAILILFFIGVKDNEEENLEQYNIAILSCTNKVERKGLIINQYYDVYDNDISKSRFVVQTHEIQAKDKKYKEVYDIYVKMSENNITKNVNEKISSGNKYITLDIDKKDDYARFSITYEYTSNNRNDMYDIFGIDVYNENINTLKSLFESGGLKCNRK